MLLQGIEYGHAATKLCLYVVLCCCRILCMSMQQQNFNVKMLSFGSRTLRMLLQNIVYEHAATKLECLNAVFWQQNMNDVAVEHYEHAARKPCLNVFFWHRGCCCRTLCMTMQQQNFAQMLSFGSRTLKMFLQNIV